MYGSTASATPTVTSSASDEPPVAAAVPVVNATVARVPGEVETVTFAGANPGAVTLRLYVPGSTANANELASTVEPFATGPPLSRR